MIKRIGSFIGVLMVCHSLLAQPDTKLNTTSLDMYNDSLGQIGGKLLDALTPLERLRYDSQFTVTLVKALQVPFSYYYPFDSIQTASILYPADSSFRIITWHYEKDGGDFRQKGAIQMNTPDGRLKLTPLYDQSEYTEEPMDSVRNNRNWIGAIYYNIITKKVQDKPVYFLIGYDENNDMTTRKWIDVLQFDESGMPLWGGDFFEVGMDSVFAQGNKRFKLEFKKSGRARLSYDQQEDLIIMDNLVSETNEPGKLYTLVPGGDYEAFKWENDHWKFIPRLFVTNLGDGNAPQPTKLLNEDGIPNEAVLGQQSEKNQQKEVKKVKKKKDD